MQNYDKHPLVSIVVPSYNYAKYISKTIESIISQTYENWELIIVDDGSKDNSVDIINTYVEQNSKIKLYRHDSNANKGLVKTLQLGINNTLGKYIVFLESDDYIINDYIEKKLQIFNKYSSVGIVCNDVELFGYDKSQEQNNKSIKSKIKITKVRRKYWEDNKCPRNISNDMYIMNVFPTFSCVMAKKELLENCNWNPPYDEYIDHWLWAQVTSSCDVYYINERLSFWRMHPESYICKTEQDNTHLKKYLEMRIKLHSVLPPIRGLKYKIKIYITDFLRILKYKYLNAIKTYFVHLIKGAQK